MNNLRNKVSLIGRLGGQPEQLQFSSGSTLTHFSLAVRESYKDKEGKWKDDTQWYTINAWGKTAERAKKMLSKGQEIIVEGRLVNRSYENKAGEKRHTTSIDVSEFLILSPKVESVK